MAFFFPSSTSTSTTTSSSSSPPHVPPSLELEDNENERSHDVAAPSLRHRSNDTPMAQSTMFGFLSQQLDYLSGASGSEISSLEDSSESDVESPWTRRATIDAEDDIRSPRSNREHIRSPSRHNRRSPKISEVHGPSQSVRVDQTRESNSASLTNQNEVEEQRTSSHRRRGYTEMDRSSRRQAKLVRDRRGRVFETFISRDFILIIILCFGMACAWIVLARPIMMNWFGGRSGDEYMYIDV